MPLNILMIGDVVGGPGRKLVSQLVPRLIRRWDLALVVCNAENAAGGSGLTAACYEEIVDAGVDVITMGDHIYRKDEIYALMDRDPRILKPANYPEESPGSEFFITKARDGSPVATISLMGRTFMKPVDCPFRAVDRVLEKIGDQAKIILVDLHAEATSDKQLMGRYLDGKVSALVGTHTHVATADDQILKGGTAYQTDLGMTGPYDSILGRRVDRVQSSTLSLMPAHFDVATGDPRLCGALIEVDASSGRATSIRRISIDQDEAQKIMTS